MNELRRLEVFRAVATRASFTRAAEALHISQPVVSRTVRELERSLGTTLLERTTRSVRLTPEGAELLVLASELLDRSEHALDRFAAYCRGDRGSIVIAVLPSIAATVLPAVLGRYHEAHGDVRFEILDVTSSEATEHVRTGKADLAIAEPSADDADLEVRTIASDAVVAVLPEGHALAQRRSLTWQALAAHPFIAMTEGSSVRRLTDLAFGQAAVHPTTVVEARNIATAGGMIAAGLGVSALPELVLPLLAFAPVTTCSLDAPVVSREIATMTRREGPVAPPAEQFLAFLHSPPATSRPGPGARRSPRSAHHR